VALFTRKLEMREASMRFFTRGSRAASARGRIVPLKTWFITGVSRGLGLALARAALARGDMVIGTVRGPAPDLEADCGRLHILQLDISDGEAVSRVVAQAFALAGGRVDVIVNIAGFGLPGAFEDATDAEAEQLFATDVLGPARVIRAALRRLRAQGSGHIINVTSITGYAPGPASCLHSAAKFALEGLSASLSEELAPLGLKVTAVAPGALRSDFHSIRLGKAGSGAYAAKAGNQLGDPDRAAAAILEIAGAEHPPRHLLLGSDALRGAKKRLAAVQCEIEQWAPLTLSTDFRAMDTAR
jgi:NAD(P)-dependent dehydrogenase (short-subunit alcohol dehydrogenase family)